MANTYLVNRISYADYPTVTPPLENAFLQADQRGFDSRIPEIFERVSRPKSGTAILLDHRLSIFVGEPRTVWCLGHARLHEQEPKDQSRYSGRGHA